MKPIKKLINENDPTIQTYNKIASHFSKSRDIDFWSEEFKIFKKLLKGQKIIDIGCGSGEDAVLFSKSKFEYTGIDASSEMLKIAKTRVKRFRFILMNFYEIDFPKESFDGFWSTAALIHVPKNKIYGVLKMINKIIKDNAVGFISTKEKITDFDEGMFKQDKLGGIERYTSFYTKDEFQKVLERNGFEVLKTHKKIEYEGTRWLCFFVRKIASR